MERRLDSQVFLDCRWLSELSCCRPIDIVAEHPSSSLVQVLPFLLLGRGFRGGDLVQVQIRSKAIVNNLDSAYPAPWTPEHVPNSKTCVQPTSILFPPSRWDRVDTHKDVSLAQLN